VLRINLDELKAQRDEALALLSPVLPEMQRNDAAQQNLAKNSKNEKLC
jgi:hypothetical protein